MKPVLNETGKYERDFYYGVIVCSGRDGWQAIFIFAINILIVVHVCQTLLW